MSIDILFLGGTSIDLIQDREDKGPKSKSIASTGGSITNSAVIAAKLGLKVAILSRIGKDSFGELAIQFMRSLGINTKGIIQDPNIHTPIAVASIDKSGNSKYTFYKNSPKDSMVPLEGVPKTLLRSPKIFHFGSSFSHQKLTSGEALKYVKFLKMRGVFISFDPNLRPYAIPDKKATKNRVLRLLKWVDMVKLSQVDLQFLTDQKNPLKGLKILKKRFRCHVILTLGSKGSVYPSPRWGEGKGEGQNNLIKVPVFKVKISDSIGAGDAFTAGLLFRLIKIGERTFFNIIKLNLIFASAVSAIICTKPGANKALKNLQQVEKFLVQKEKIVTSNS